MSCITPFVKKKKHSNDTEPCPCGKCPGCRNARASQWSFRLVQEEKVSESAHFITLTYDTAFVPITKNGFMELSRRHVQLFFKRLRKCISDDRKKSNNGSRIGAGRPVRYYVVGEYGGKTERPHYHIILFNCELKYIQPAWNMGSVHYGQVTGASVGYCMKYITKPNKVPKHRNDDRQPEFALMSKGLGMSYLTPQMIEWHNKTMDRMYVTTDDGKKYQCPGITKSVSTLKKLGKLSEQKQELKQSKELLRGFEEMVNISIKKPSVINTNSINKI